MRKTRILLSLLLAVLMLAGTVAFGGLSAAAMGEPTDLYWSSTTACWTPPDVETSYFQIELYKDGSLVTSGTAYGGYFSFSDTIANCGPGDYYFTVASAYTEGPAWISEAVTSPSQYFSGTSGGCSHTLVHIAFSYPTCTEDGEKGHYECTNCGRWFWDEGATAEIADHDETVTEKLGHAWGEWYVVDDPTTEKEGLAQRVCSNDSDHVETKTLKKLSDGENPEKEVEKLNEQEKKETENKPEATKAQDATKATEATSATKATEATSATVSAQEAKRVKKVFDDAWLITLLIIAGCVVLIAAVIVVLIVLLRKNRKKDDNSNTPPSKPPTVR